MKAYFNGKYVPGFHGGQMAYGGVLYHHGEKIHQFASLCRVEDERPCNSLAQYIGVLEILRYLISHDAANEEIIILGDSRVVIGQLDGSELVYIMNPLIHYFIQANILLTQFSERPKFQLISSLENTEAQNIVNDCLASIML